MEKGSSVPMNRITQTTENITYPHTTYVVSNNEHIILERCIITWVTDNSLTGVHAFFTLLKIYFTAAHVIGELVFTNVALDSMADYKICWIICMKIKMDIKINLYYHLPTLRLLHRNVISSDVLIALYLCPLFCGPDMFNIWIENRFMNGWRENCDLHSVLQRWLCLCQINYSIWKFNHSFVVLIFIYCSNFHWTCRAGFRITLHPVDLVLKGFLIGMWRRKS